ncbi:MAG: DNA polymerase III subunit delta [Parcubacteria group bacterium]
MSALKAAFIKKAGRGATIESVEVGSTTTARGLMGQLGASSLFAAKRLVVVRGLMELRLVESRALVVALKKKPLATGTSLVCVATEPLPPATKQPLVTFFKKNAAVRRLAVSQPISSAIPQELVQRATSLGVKLSVVTARHLFERVNDFDRAVNELDKLALYAATQPTKEITQNDIDALVECSLESDVFDLIRAIAAGQRAQAAKLLHQQLAAGAHPLYLLAMLRYQFRTFMLVAEAQKKANTPRDIQVATGLSPYVIRSVQQSLGRFTPQRISATYSKLVDADEAIKTSAIEGDVALDLLVMALAA